MKINGGTVLKNIKVAFMMAWHPRLGRYSLIRKYVNKDIGKLIASYFTVERLVTKDHELIIHKNEKSFDYTLTLGVPSLWPVLDFLPLHHQQMDMFPIHYIDEKISLRPIMIELSGMCMGINETSPNEKASSMSMFFLIDDTHTTILRDICNQILLVLDRVRPETYRYSKPFKLPGDDPRYNTTSTSIKLDMATKVYDGNGDRSVFVPMSEAINKEWFKHKPKCKVILYLSQVVCSKGIRVCSVTKSAKQFLVYRPRKTIDDCLFSESE